MDRDALGRKIPYSSRPQIWRLRKWQTRSKAYRSVDRNLAQAMAELDRLSDKLSMSRSIKENAALIYRKALEKGLVRGRSIAGIAAASLYAACRDSETPRTLREIAQVSLVGKKDVARGYRLLLRELNIQMPIADPMTYMSKIAERAGISGQIQGLAIKILKEAKTNRVTSGKDPMGMAAAALYIACVQSNEKKPQKDIAEAAGVTEVTVRNRYKRLKSQLSSELPD
jgi:transcription initiation factor TFIIB